MNNTHFLKKVQLFSELEGDDVARVAEIASEKTHKKNEVIFHENDPGSVLFVLKSGAVKISVCDRNGKEDILKIIYPGDFFGDMSLLDGKHRSATVSAMEKSVSIIIQKGAFSVAHQYAPQSGHEYAGNHVPEASKDR